MTTNIQAANSAAVDYSLIKTRQQGAWSSGDYAVVGTTLQIVGEELCEALDLLSGETVLDVAAGNGNASLAAARRWAHVTSTDYVASLLERGRERARAEGLVLDFREADVENLPFRDGEFDVVLSTFGVMFSPNQEKAAAEMARVLRSGGRIGLANWTPGGFIGQLFKTIGKHVPPAPGLRSPAQWGSVDRLNELFKPLGCTVMATPKSFNFRYRSAQHWLDVFRTYYGPVLKAFAALNPQGQAELQRDLLMLVGELNRGLHGTMVVPSEYLEVVIQRS